MTLLKNNRRRFLSSVIPRNAETFIQVGKLFQTLATRYNVRCKNLKYILILLSRLHRTLFEWQGIKLCSLLAKAVYHSTVFFFSLSLFIADTNVGQSYRLTHCIKNLHSYNIYALSTFHTYLQKYYTKEPFSCMLIAHKCNISCF